MTEPSQVIYVHGFGGRDNAPPFFVALSSFFRANKLRFDCSTFAWDSLPVEYRTLAANFLQSQDEAELASKSLLKRLRDLECQKLRYYLVGFSLGALVIRYALDAQDALLGNLNGVYLLGAAFNHDEPVNEDVIPSHARCHNYFSTSADMVLNRLHFNVAGVSAAGSRPLTHARRFHNLATHCSHTLVHNYSVLGPAIGSLVAWDDEQQLEGAVKTNVELGTMGGKTWWDEICYHNDHVVQQNYFTKHFRAIELNPPRRRKAWGGNLHAILRAL